MELKKVAIVTGASTGIGREIAIELAKNNVYVVLVGRRNLELEKTKEIINKNNGSSDIFLMDLTDFNSVSLLENFISQNLKPPA